jgi:lysophospholipase L1-like esterase
MIMKNNTPTKESLSIIMGLLFIAAGVLCNEWFLVALISTDGAIAVSHRIIIWIVDICLIGTGYAVIRYRMTLTREALFTIAGLSFIFVSIVFSEKFIPAVMDVLMTSQNRLFLRGIEIYFIITGIMLILYRKSIDFNRVLLFGISSLFCITLFLAADWYIFYSKIIQYRSDVNAYIAENPELALTERDAKLGWKLIAKSGVRNAGPKAYNVSYEIDELGYKKVNNSKERPAFSMYFFGDSYTFGEGVSNEDTFTNIIKDKYLIDEVNVYNAGVGGYGIVQMFQRFLDMKDRIQPGDLVIFTPITNDIKRNLKDFFMPYFTKFTNIMDVENYPYFKDGVITYRKMENSFYNKLKLSVLSARYTGYYFRSIYNKLIPDTTMEAQEMIRIVEQETKLRGGEFVLFFLPRTEECFSGKYEVDISRFHYFDIMHFFPTEIDKMNKLVLSKSDGHYNRSGHEVAAKAIVDTLVDEKIIDGKYVVYADSGPETFGRNRSGNTLSLP